MTGKLIPAMTHGQNESILLALASSSAPALYGFAKREATEMCEGLPGCSVLPLIPSGDVCKSEGERSGDEKERRYRAMKKTSLSAQKRNRTV